MSADEEKPPETDRMTLLNELANLVFINDDLRGEIKMLRQMIWALLWSQSDHKITVPDNISIMAGDTANQIEEWKNPELFCRVYTAKRPESK